VNRQEFRVVIVPGTDVISVEALKVLRRFQESGGAVIGTTALPTRSAELGRDGEVQELVAEIFTTAELVPDPTAEALRRALDRVAPSADVSFAGSPRPRSGNGQLAYIHKVKSGRDIVFIANSSDDEVSTTVSIRGALQLEVWDPYDGSTRLVGAGVVATDAGLRTEVAVRLPAVSSTVLISSAPSTS
jgi:hypothetical protein